jgi:hypothetical protein
MMNNTKTCVTIEACNTNIAEAHNFRKVKLDGIRSDLSDQNVYEYKVSASERLAIIKREYKQTVGQRLQSHAHPVIEMVVVGIITRGQAELFVKKIEEKWGVEVLSWAVHVDEGHYDVTSGDWIANYHAHFIVDTTYWTHDPMPGNKKRHGTILRDPKGDAIVECRDRYARRRHFEKEDLSSLQDIAAEVTGLKRGDPSTIQRIRALQYKAIKTQNDLQELSRRQEEMILCNKRLDEQLAGSYQSLRSLARRIIGAVDSHIDIFSVVGGPKRISKINEKRDDLEKWMSLAPEQSSTPLIELVSSFSLTLTDFFLCVFAVFMTAIDELKKQLHILRKEKARRLKQSAQSAVATLLGKPANEKMKQLAEENQYLKKTITQLKVQNSDLSCALEKMESEMSLLREHESGRQKERDRYRESLVERSHIQEMKYMLTSDLSAKIQPQEIDRLEYLGLPTLLGSKNWETVKQRVLQNNLYKKGIK